MRLPWTIRSSKSRAPPRACPRSRSASTPGVPVNMTLLFSAERYRGRGRGLPAGGAAPDPGRKLDPAVGSVASLFVSRRDAAVADRVPDELRNRLGIAVAEQAYRAYRELLVSASLGAAGQRRRPGAAAAVGLDLGQGSARPVTCCTWRRWPPRSSSTPCRIRTLEAFADHGHRGRVPARRRRRRRPGYRRVRPGRDRHRGPGRRAAAPGRGGVRGLLAGSAGPDQRPTQQLARTA